MSDAKSSNQPPAATSAQSRKRVSTMLGLDQLLQITSPRNWLALSGLLLIIVGGLIWSVFATLPHTVTGNGLLLRSDSAVVVAPASGLVSGMSVSEGDSVQSGQDIATITQPDGTTVEVTTPISGTVTGVSVADGLQTRQGATLVSIERLDQPLSVVAYLPLESGKAIDTGMQAQVSPSTTEVESYGYLRGTVSSVSNFPVTPVDIIGLTGTDTLAQDFLVDGPVIQIIVELQEDDSTTSGYAWSSSDGPPFQLKSGTPVTAAVVSSEDRPIDLLFTRL